VPTVRRCGHWDDLGILGTEGSVIGSYEEQRRKEARAQVLRVLRLVGQPDDFFRGKVVVDVGPGCVGMLEMSDAREKYAVEPLADEFREHGLLLEGDFGVEYFAQGAESIPLPDDYADVVVAFNSLDHVDDVQACVREIDRVLKIGGHFLLNVEIDHAPTEAEPHALSEADVRALLPNYAPAYYSLAVPPYGAEVSAELSHDAKWLRACFRKVSSAVTPRGTPPGGKWPA
jgi:SAM-dependent methyltransferase